MKYKERGLLSSKTTTIKSRDESKTVTASTLSGEAVQITAGRNTNMTGSQVIGTHDVAISSGKDTSIYGKFGWIELYFEIALYNSQYQIDSIKNGEYYE